MAEPVVQVNCWCMTCESQVLEARTLNGDRFAWATRMFIVCPDCGNKRCPRAAHHGHACTGSNEAGQPGSAYPGMHVEPIEPRDRPSAEYIQTLRDLGAPERTIELALRGPRPSRLRRWFSRG